MNFVDLKSYRNEEGYIDIDKIDLSKFETHEEIRGSNTEDREKLWVKLNDANVMLRTELFTDEETKNYCNYAELIYEELSKQVGLESAHYDLMKYKDKKGVITKDVRNENEILISLKSLMPSDEVAQEFDSTFVDLSKVVKMFKNLMKNPEFYAEDVLKTAEDFYKLNIFNLFTVSTDTHLENCAVLTSPGEDGKKHMRLSPAFDNELCLALGTPIADLESIYRSDDSFSLLIDTSAPLIQYMEDEDDVESTWFDTLNALTSNEEFLDFARECYHKLDIDSAIKEVENRCNISLPDLAKDTAKRAFDFRKNEIMCELEFDFDDLDSQDNDKWEI